MRAAASPGENPKVICWTHPWWDLQPAGFSFQQEKGNAGNKVCHKEKLQRGLKRLKSSKRTARRESLEKLRRNPKTKCQQVPRLSLNSLPAHGVRQHWGDAFPSRKGERKRGWDSTGTVLDPAGAAAHGAPTALGFDPPAVPAPWMPPGLGQRGSGHLPTPCAQRCKTLGN